MVSKEQPIGMAFPAAYFGSGGETQIVITLMKSNS